MSKYKTAVFPKEELLLLIGGDSETLKLVKDEIVDNSRWSIIHSLIFKDDNEVFYSTEYSVGATEYQDELPFEYEGDNVTVIVVEPVEVTVIHYKGVLAD